MDTGPSGTEALRHPAQPHRDGRSSGHQFNSTTANGSARVHMGDVYGSQHNYYGAVPPSRSDAEISLLDALAYEGMHFRSSTVTPSYAKTCDRVFEASPYKSWRDQRLVSEHNGFLWIKGKPGAGKSTVMKHAWEYAQATYENETTISFFFHARGAAMGKSIEGMYRCLLHQIAERVPQLSSKINNADRRSYQSKGWPVTVLENLFRQDIPHLCRETRLSCYIDALDEGDDEDQVRQMVDILYEVAERAACDSLSFSVCLASRYYPKISVGCSKELRLEEYEGHENDISDYVDNKLRIRAGELKQKLTFEIKRRSSGIFLWVVLVVATLNKEGDRGNQHLLWQQLQEIPDDLMQILDDLRTRDSSDNRFLPAIEWVLYALRPLNPQELYFAILTSIGQLTAENVFWDEKMMDAKMIEDFILSSSKGLLEISSEAASLSSDALTTMSSAISAADFSGGEVQFFHEVVREYFLDASIFDAESVGSYHIDVQTNEADPEQNLVHHYGGAASSDSRLSIICQTYLRTSYESERLRSSILPHTVVFWFRPYFPFLEYSLDQALRHADRASKFGKPVGELAQNFPLHEWTFLQIIEFSYTIQAARCIFSHHYMASTGDL